VRTAGEDQATTDGRSAMASGRDAEDVYRAMREIEGRIDEALLLRSVDRIGVEEVRALVGGRLALRRACCERIRALAAEDRELAQALCVVGASDPGRVDDACDVVRPAESSVRRRIARRRRAGVSAEELERALERLGKRRAREVLSRRDCYRRLVGVAADSARGLSERDAAVTVAAADYDAARALVGAPRFEEIGRRARQGGLGAALRRERERGVAEEAIGGAIERLGRERVEAALAQEGLPFARMCVEAAAGCAGEERSVWLTLGAAGAARTWRALPRRTVRLGGARGGREMPVSEALAEVRSELFGTAA
jgi:hypothetical protein